MVIEITMRLFFQYLTRASNKQLILTRSYKLETSVNKR